MSREKDETLLNEQIVADEIRCIGDDGTQYGVISKNEAQKIANEQGLDLVLVSPTANPPVCKIMDFGKFKYQQNKKLKEAKKKQKVIEVKEIKLSVKIAQNDVNFKVKQARDFITSGKHVKFRVFLRGREMSNPEAGVDVLENVWKLVEDIADKDKDPMLEGRYVNMLTFPKKS